MDKAIEQLEVSATMKLIAEFASVRWYLAECPHFKRPGVYYWDGKTNVHVFDSLRDLVAERDNYKARLEKIKGEAEDHADGTSDATPLERFANDIYWIAKGS